MDKTAADGPGVLPWSMRDIPYRNIDREALRDHAALFELLASASFIEMTSDLYTRNLVEYFRGDDAVVGWLTQHWEPEELQHGAALRRYVRTAWPQFDWTRAYQGFYEEYSRCCLLDRLATSRSLEMVARCVIETGTSSFYRFLANASAEPVLRELAGRIAADEVRHYKNFYRFLRRYREDEHPGRTAVLRTLCSRVSEIDSEDGYIAFKHVFTVRNPGADCARREYERFMRGIGGLVYLYFPSRMAVKMFLKPLDLPPLAGRMIGRSATTATRVVLRWRAHRAGASRGARRPAAALEQRGT